MGSTLEIAAAILAASLSRVAESLYGSELISPVDELDLGKGRVDAALDWAELLVAAESDRARRKLHRDLAN